VIKIAEGHFSNRNFTESAPSVSFCSFLDSSLSLLLSLLSLVPYSFFPIISLSLPSHALASFSFCPWANSGGVVWS
jgi:hypothetical protein